MQCESLALKESIDLDICPPLPPYSLPHSSAGVRNLGKEPWITWAVRAGGE